MLLMTEVAELKAGMLAQDGSRRTGAEGGEPGQDPAALTAMLDKLTGSINERLDKFGRKIGVSTAVDGGDVNFDGLFASEHDKPLESNMSEVQAKKTQGNGIAANLERLKKLKGDG